MIGSRNEAQDPRPHRRTRKAIAAQTTHKASGPKPTKADRTDLNEVRDRLLAQANAEVRRLEQALGKCRAAYDVQVARTGGNRCD